MARPRRLCQPGPAGRSRPLPPFPRARANDPRSPRPFPNPHAEISGSSLYLAPRNPAPHPPPPHSHQTRAAAAPLTPHRNRALPRRSLATPSHCSLDKPPQELRPDATNFVEPTASDLGPAAHGISRGEAPSSRPYAAPISILRHLPVDVPVVPCSASDESYRLCITLPHTLYQTFFH